MNAVLSATIYSFRCPPAFTFQADRAMSHHRPTFLLKEALSPGWFALALGHLPDPPEPKGGYKDPVDKEEKKELHYLNIGKRRLAEHLALQFFHALRDEVKKDGITNKAFQERLVVPKTTLHHWSYNQHKPHAHTFFTALVFGLKKDLNQFKDFPSNRDLLHKAILGVLRQIREEDCGQETKFPPTDEELATLRQALHHRHADALLPGSGSLDSNAERLLASLRQKLSQPPYHFNSHPRTILDVVKVWGLPYALFTISVPPKWGEENVQL